jgi:uncharacterized protein YwqG
MTLLQLPKVLEPFREKIESTQRSTVRIYPKAGISPQVTQSKIGGTPYWLQTMDYPRGVDGRTLFFLAQLNFAEIPPLEGYPSKGLLQFFIADDDLYGLDLDNPGQAQNYRVVFHPEPKDDLSTLETSFAFLPDFEDNTPIPSTAAIALDFKVETEYLGPPDCQFDVVYPEAFLSQFGEAEEEAMDFFYELGAKASGHKIGGYAFFTQYDPRNAEQPMLLLFQLDSDSDIDSMWGDMGIANFFISAADLQALRFDRVWYNWDCS